jgi:hypothetical protein
MAFIPFENQEFLYYLTPAPAEPPCEGSATVPLYRTHDVSFGKQLIISSSEKPAEFMSERTNAMPAKAIIMTIYIPYILNMFPNVDDIT